MNGNYGVTRDIYAKMKIAGFVFWKLITVSGSLVGAFLSMNAIFPTEGLWRYVQLVYVILTPVWVGFLLKPTVGGKTLLWSFWLAFIRKKRFYRSFQR